MADETPIERPDGPHVTVVALPDTQKYVQNRPEPFERQTEWIADNVDAENIGFVVHEGDVAQQPKHVYYQRANRAMETLDRADVPYLATVGNHDYADTSSRDASTFEQYFPRSRFVERPWWGGSFDGTAYNAYATFEALEEDYLVLSLELFPREEVLAWADDVLEAHADHRALLVTHAYLYMDGTPIDTGDKWDRTVYDLEGHNGDELWERFLDRHANLSVVCSGHVLCDGSARRTTAGRHGNPVHQILTNYQTLEDGGQGYLRLLRFYPEESVLTAEAYSPVLDEYHPDDEHHFRIDDAF